MTKQSKFIYSVFYAIHSKTQYAPSRQILCHEGLNRITEQGSFIFCRRQLFLSVLNRILYLGIITYSRLHPQHILMAGTGLFHEAFQTASYMIKHAVNPPDIRSYDCFHSFSSVPVTFTGQKTQNILLILFTLFSNPVYFFITKNQLFR